MSVVRCNEAWRWPAKPIFHQKSGLVNLVIVVYIGLSGKSGFNDSCFGKMIFFSVFFWKNYPARGKHFCLPKIVGEGHPFISPTWNGRIQNSGAAVTGSFPVTVARVPGVVWDPRIGSRVWTLPFCENHLVGFIPCPQMCVNMLNTSIE